MLTLLAHPILVTAAVVPAVWLLIKVYRVDRLDRESRPLLLSLVLYGILATFLAMLAERVGSFVLGIFFREDGRLYNLLLYFVVVGGAEEGAKFILLRRRTWQSPEFNCQFDGVVYSVFVALGFALWENIGYVLMFGLRTAVLRAVTAVPGHACFGVFMGVWYGMAKRAERAGDMEKATRYQRTAFLLPLVLHGCYDYIASLSRSGASLLFLVFIAALFFLSYRLIVRSAQNDKWI